MGGSSMEFNVYNIGTIAAWFGTTAQRLNGALERMGILVKVDNEWRIADKYKDQGFMVTLCGYSGDKEFYYQKWTQKGADFIRSIIRPIDLWKPIFLDAVIELDEEDLKEIRERYAYRRKERQRPPIAFPNEQKSEIACDENLDRPDQSS